MIERKKYLERIEPFIDKDIIKVLVGMRRCGKSTLLESIREMIINRGIPRENTLIMNFESMKWEDTATSARSFYNTVISFTKNMTGRSYLFLMRFRQLWIGKKQLIHCVLILIATYT